MILSGLVMSIPCTCMCLSPYGRHRPDSLSTHQAASSLLYIKLTILAFHVPLPLAVGMRSWSSILATLFSDREPSGLILSSKGLRFAALVLALAVRAFLALLTSSAVPALPLNPPSLVPLALAAARGEGSAKKGGNSVTVRALHSNVPRGFFAGQSPLSCM